MKQRIQGSHFSPCHRYMVVATPLIVQCFALLHCSANQTSAECGLEFTTAGGYRMFPWLSGSAVTFPLVRISHAPRGFIHAAPHSLARQAASLPVSRGSDNSSTKEIQANRAGGGG